MAEQPSVTGAKARILQLRHHLSSIAVVSFRSRSGMRSQCHWSGEGQGRVEVVQAEDGSLALYETGHFSLESSFSSPAGKTNGPSRQIPFFNVFRWRFAEQHVSLSHERRGTEAAVWLFDFVTAGDEETVDLVSHATHVCIDDHYQAQLTFRPNGFDLEWTITGPRKDEHIHYIYRVS